MALGFSPATVIDVGVAYGTNELYSRFPDARHLLIEPLEEYEPHLKAICSQYNLEYVLGAAGASPGNMETVVSPDLMASSLLWSEGEKRKVPIVTLDDICIRLNLTGSYLIKVDVQGAELYVLDGASAILEETEVIILEVSFFRFSIGFPEFFNVIDYMKNGGSSITKYSAVITDHWIWREPRSMSPL